MPKVEITVHREDNQPDGRISWVVVLQDVRAWQDIYCYYPREREVFSFAMFDFRRSRVTPMWRRIQGISPVTGEPTVYLFERRIKP